MRYVFSRKDTVIIGKQHAGASLKKKMNSRFKSSSIENRVLHHFHAIETNLIYLEICFDDSCSFTVIITRGEKRIHEQKSSEIRSLPN